MSAARLAWQGAFLVCTVGCDSVGNALVTKWPVTDAGGPLHLRCVDPPPCEPVARPKLPERRETRPIDLETCGRTAITTCDTLPAADDDAGVDTLREAGCRPQYAASAPDTLSGAVLDCAQISVLGGADVYRISGATLRHSNLVLRATTPMTFVLDQPTLEEVFFELDGPVTLRIEAARSLDDVRVAEVTGAADAALAPTVEVLRSTARKLTVFGDVQDISGTITMEEVELHDVQLAASEIVLKSVSLAGGSITATHLTGSDVQISDAVLDVGDTLLSAFTLRRTMIDHCATTLLIAGTLLDSTLAPCDGPPVRFYSMKVIGGAVDGAVESDRSDWTGVRLGPQAATEFVAFAGTVSSVTFCSRVKRAEFGDGVSISCVDCEDDFVAAGAACTLPSDVPPTTLRNFCPTFDPIAPLSPCEAPLPMRLRPLEQPF